jgi:phosphate transport system substrate-binding protein
MRRLSQILLTLCTTWVLTSCNDGGSNAPTDTPTSGTLNISADETFRPVIEEQMRVFDSAFPDAHVTVQYKSEEECVKDFTEGKTRFILVTRTLTAPELARCEQKSIVPDSLSLARDGIAVIVNPTSADTLMDLARLRGILNGVSKEGYTAVFDNNGSSTVRFATQSILGGGALGAGVYAAGSGPDVVDYVSKNPKAVGFIGMGYISDSMTGQFLTNIKVARIRNDSLGTFLKPDKAYLALRTYPLYRTVYYIHSETYRGLGNGVAKFLRGERGQLIFNRAFLFPLRMNVTVRPARINSTSGVGE